MSYLRVDTPRGEIKPSCLQAWVGEKMPPKVKEDVLAEIREKQFEQSMEEKDTKKKEKPDLEL